MRASGRDGQSQRVQLQREPASQRSEFCNGSVNVMMHAGGELDHPRVSLRGGVRRQLIRKPREHHVARLRKRPIRWREQHQFLFDPERVTLAEIIVPPRPQRPRAITITDNLVSIRAPAQDSHLSSLVCVHANRNKACTPDSSRPTRRSCEHLVKPSIRENAAPHPQTSSTLTAAFASPRPAAPWQANQDNRDGSAYTRRHERRSRHRRRRPTRISPMAQPCAAGRSRPGRRHPTHLPTPSRGRRCDPRILRPDMGPGDRPLPHPR